MIKISSNPIAIQLDANIKRARLIKLAKIASDPVMKRGGAQNLLNEALKEVPETPERLNKLKQFFNMHISQGWLTKVDKDETPTEMSEDENFLYKAPQTGNPFWWDWG